MATNPNNFRWIGTGYKPEGKTFNGQNPATATHLKIQI